MDKILLILLGSIIMLSLDLLLIAARSSLFQISNARLLGLRDHLEIAVAKTLALTANLTRLRAGLNLALTITRFVLAGLFWLLFSVWLPYSWALLLILLAGALALFWLEWLVESIVARNPETWALRMTTFTKFVLWTLSVFLLPLRVSQTGQVAPEPAGLVTQDELKNLVDAGEEEGILEQGERRMIFSIFQLGQTLVREIMVPRIDMLALDVDTNLLDAVDALLSSGYSRVPVYEENVDNTLGVLYAKDLLRVWREGGELTSLSSLLRDAYFVPEGKKVDELLAEMQSQRVHVAVVVDEYGGVAGLVTLEDIIEEILGEIQDEYDEGEEAPYQQVSDTEYLFRGRIDLDDFNEIMESDLPGDEADTLGGYIYSRLGRVPTVGEQVSWQNLLMVVEQVSARRIRKVRALWALEDEQGEED